MFERLRGARARALWQDTSGGVAMVFSLAFIPLVIAIGVAVDAGRAYVVETRMMTAVDMAALAAANPDNDMGDEIATREQIARIGWEYFRRNLGLDDGYDFDSATADYDPGSDGLADIEVASSDGIYVLDIVRQEGPDVPDIVVSAQTNMPTTFMRVAGYYDVTIAVTTEVTGSRQGIELVLVMDNTGSMRDGGSNPPSANSSMERMKDAARGLINRLFIDRFDTASRFDSELTESGDISYDTLWVGLVPYAATVNIGRTNMYQEWTEAGGWSYSTFHPTPHEDAPIEYSVDHMDWLTTDMDRFPLVQIDDFDQFDGFAGPERPSINIDSYYEDSYRTEHVAEMYPNDYYMARCYRDTEDFDDDDDRDEYLYLADGAHASGLTRGDVCQTVDGDPRGWLGCVMARPSPHDVNESPPDGGVSTSLFAPFRWVSDSNVRDENSSESSSGSLNGCQNSEHYNDEENKQSNPDQRDPYCYNSWPETWNDNGDPIYWAQNGRQNSGLGPNLGCPQQITPMTNNYTVIMDSIDRMQPWHRGGTWTNLGMAWGWYVISPRWRDEWALPYLYEEEQLPLEYGNEDIRKVVVVLTDGTNQWYQDDFTAHGYLEEGRPTSEGGLGSSNENTATSNANDRMLSLCRDMRGESEDDNDPDNDQIIIYTIVLDADGQEDTFRNCASAANNFFVASDSGQLAGIFEQIADDLSALRISR